MLCVLATAGVASAGPAPGFAASYTLAEGDARVTTTNTGSIAVAATGEAYVDVATPVDQKIWMGAKGMAVYYPEEELVV
ncbi:MAG: hypothetical protein AAB368_00385, partial [bacterium]